MVKAGISLKHIEAYDAIAATGSTVAAALELGISQSNASRLLQQLEDYLGVRLFERDKNRLAPTREGLQLGPEIRAIADRLRVLKTAAIELENGRSRDMLLRLAFPASLSSNRIPKMIRDFLAANGPMRVELASGNYLALERMVADGEADIGFARLPLATPGLRQEKLLPSRIVCVLHRDHLLAERSSLTIAELKGHDLIVLNRERPVRHQLEALFYQHGLRQRPLLEAHSVASACALAAEGLGIALVSELIAREYAALPLRFVVLEPELPVTYCLLSGEKHPLSRAAGLFLQSIAGWS
ncbi:Transcriptional activator protein LysR (plasmid) [Neorhizobium galegae bv. officinalis bv. officinalis str. HAMBI 1141]|uniref:Transcriptional activator protein LysR n=1 Tax=Neorhizobium galegae bv. officinalis bv. officinalis str. HAMBI 1141 TaxID=1028801 RepID=A0A068TGI5_NEOGA|nr:MULTISPECIES: LysR family transcriptional regulator [Neorhizobium]MCJ9669615.1 LysR family transcriptional regulator [Neorhizobium sp. SHOUNA12B]MCJ9745992.1 LysR family transcriptional regulator [Neorhizobium sp. SHOUNA12A]CDN57468.1 Transcriptional activator protein LysR [Neorhizobium galegae bv. officinalis bv. officinalis str. HAMBI 1141]